MGLDFDGRGGPDRAHENVWGRMAKDPWNRNNGARRLHLHKVLGSAVAELGHGEDTYPHEETHEQGPLGHIRTYQQDPFNGVPTAHRPYVAIEDGYVCVLPAVPQALG